MTSPNTEKTAAYKLGLLDVLEKIAKSGLRPRAIGELISEGGNLSKGVIKRFGISAGELNKGNKISRKMRRKKMFQEETTKRSLTAARTKADSFFNRPGSRAVTSNQNPFAKTVANRRPPSPTAATAIKPGLAS